jgi:hypothetical protein
MKDVISQAAMLCGVVAVLLGLRAATIRVRKHRDFYFIETAMEDVARQSFWATWTSIAAAASTVLQAIEWYF